mgnify:CR=1 FL=1
MVDVGDKQITERLAIARGEVHLTAKTLGLIRQGLMKKGDVLGVARIAGIQAAKRTWELIPLCHPIIINQVEVELVMDEVAGCIRIEAAVRTSGKTGVEMEALTAVSVTALTVYDMVKAVERTARIQNIRLIEKHGGRSGDVVIEK